MVLESVRPTCHPADMTFPTLPQAIKAGKQFRDQEESKGELT